MLGGIYLARHAPAVLPSPTPGERCPRIARSEQLGARLIATIEPDHIGHADLFRTGGDSFNRVARRHLAFLHHREINPGSAALPEPFHHVRPPESYSQLEARHARLRHLQHSRAHAELISDRDTVLGDTLGGQVLTEPTVRELESRQLLLPIAVMLPWIAVNRLIRPTVYRQIGLPVSLDIVPAHGDSAFDRRFEDARQHGGTVCRHLPRSSHIDRNNTHKYDCWVGNPARGRPFRRLHPSVGSAPFQGDIGGWTVKSTPPAYRAATGANGQLRPMVGRMQYPPPENPDSLPLRIEKQAAIPSTVIDHSALRARPAGARHVPPNAPQNASGKFPRTGSNRAGSGSGLPRNSPKNRRSDRI